jgi:hypothetical protein
VRYRDWVREHIRSHELIEFGDDGHEKESAAGAYLGKYLSATFGSLLNASESFEQGDGERESYADKAATGNSHCTGRRTGGSGLALSQLRRESTRTITCKTQMCVRPFVGVRSTQYKC